MESGRPTVLRCIEIPRSATEPGRGPLRAVFSVAGIDEVTEEARTAVIQRPAEGRAGTASYERVRRWLADEDVPTLTPDELTQQLTLDVAHA